MVDQKEVFFRQTNNNKIDNGKVDKKVDFTNLKVKKRTVIERIFDLKASFGFFKEGLSTLILIFTLYCLVYFNKLDFVRNIDGVSLEKFTRAGNLSNLRTIVFEGKSASASIAEQTTQEDLMDINTQANKDNFIIWTWNFWYFLSQGNLLQAIWNNLKLGFQE